MKRGGTFRITPHMPVTATGELAEMGMKAFDLARMARIGLPVPPAFVLGTSHCRNWYREPERVRKSLAGLLEEQMHWLQSVTDLGFGDTRKPLLVSVRSGAPVSMPGMMDTLLNIGLCDATLHGLLRLTGNPRLVWDSYCRLIRCFSEVVYGAGRQQFDSALDLLLERERLERYQELDYMSLAELSQAYLDIFSEQTGHPFPQNPLTQLELAVEAVFTSWSSPRAVEYRRLHSIPYDLYTAVTIQRMVFGNGGGTSGAGVGFTRDPDSGEKRLYFDFLFNNQGEDIVSGRTARSDAESLFIALPETRQELQSVCCCLEQEFRDAQEFEFTIQNGSLFLLQSRTAKRTDWAALRIAVEQEAEGLIERGEALARLDGLALDTIMRRKLSPECRQPLCQGQTAGIGVAAGQLAFDIDAVRRLTALKGGAVVLVREEMSTADIAGIALSAGVLTARGSRTSHAAVVARQLGKPCISSCPALRIDMARRRAIFGDRSLAEGETITLDSNTGRVYAGVAEIVVERPTEWLEVIGKWRRSHHDGEA